MASAINALNSSSAATPPTSASGPAGATAPTEQVFLQLLVAQLKNQDPMSPTDGTQFIAQLAQFSELEQVIAIRSDIEANGGSTTPPATQTDTSGQTTKTGQIQS